MSSTSSYCDRAWWAKLDAAGCRVVTRLKANTPLAVNEAAVSATRPVPAGGGILSGRTGTLPARRGKGRPNPMSAPVREVRVRISTGPALRVLTNDLQDPAQEIAGLHKRRWAVELFLRWVKQALKATRFLGASENAVRIQVACALIALLLPRAAQAAQPATQPATQAAVASPLAFARLVRNNLTHLRALAGLARPPPHAASVPGQGTAFAK